MECRYLNIFIPNLTTLEVSNAKKISKKERTIALDLEKVILWPIDILDTEIYLSQLHEDKLFKQPFKRPTQQQQVNIMRTSWLYFEPSK